MSAKKIYHTEEERQEARRIARRKWEILNPDKWELQKRNQRLKRRYGIKLDEYDELFTSQKGLCAICHNPPKGIHSSGRAHILHVDHCHTTGKIRGLLCTACNQALGMFKEDIGILKKAMEYINANSR
jgi:hypothetical protein